MFVAVKTNKSAPSFSPIEVVTHRQIISQHSVCPVCVRLGKKCGPRKPNYLSHATCTFEQWVLFEEHSHHTFRRWRRPARDDRSGLSSNTLDHVCKCHGTMTHVTAVATGVCWHYPLSQNNTGWHLSTGVGERVLANGCVKLL